MVFLGLRGYRCIAHDRRGHGRSSQPWGGNDMDTYADDLAALAEALGPAHAIHVGHSTGGGEVRATSAGTARSAWPRRADRRGAAAHAADARQPGGLPMRVFDDIRAGVLADRSQFFKDLTTPFYGANRPGAKVSQGCATRSGCRACRPASRASIDCIKAFSETDFTEDLKKIDVPTLIMHGDDDQIVPIDASALPVASW
jgi:non-heme chloroperoxidase